MTIVYIKDQETKRSGNKQEPGSKQSRDKDQTVHEDVHVGGEQVGGRSGEMKNQRSKRIKTSRGHRPERIRAR